MDMVDGYGVWIRGIIFTLMEQSILFENTVMDMVDGYGDGYGGRRIRAMIECAP